ncbi:N-acetyltransferase [Oxalobacter vibrioformis]|uniref:N-acetyltransferase n=1 Tax=Oxalobacter vibrioformis TaxID=933080 RepID=A0A9E9P411_9BURK|nr:N-acetyltransferase [Oxalobacter vibrioformis]WAW09661.1 N-acetyltransferase [Oxalobacter vibrioformis]
MRIRPEKPEEFPYLYDFVQTAFATAKVSDGTEPDFVNVLREGVNYIPDLALVAEADGKIIGHIMFTRTYLSVPGKRFEALLLAPVAVALEQRDRGIGSALIEEGMRRAKAMGFTSIFLVGDPDYYSRFGFHPVASYGIRHNSEIPDQYIMAKALVPGVLDGIDGTITII